jgi:hypothetical protein
LATVVKKRKRDFKSKRMSSAMTIPPKVKYETRNNLLKAAFQRTSIQTPKKKNSCQSEARNPSLAFL